MAHVGEDPIAEVDEPKGLRVMLLDGESAKVDPKVDEEDDDGPPPEKVLENKCEDVSKDGDDMPSPALGLLFSPTGITTVFFTLPLAFRFPLASDVHHHSRCVFQFRTRRTRHVICLTFVSGRAYH